MIEQWNNYLQSQQSTNLISQLELKSIIIYKTLF